MIIRRKWPWIAQQEWRDILFLHWPVPAEELEPLIPQPFKLDTFEGQAWIGFVLFKASRSRLRGIPKSLAYPSFLQLNVRTYVKYGNERGVHFFSLDANRNLAVKGAKLGSLPYIRSDMSYFTDREKLIFASERSDAKLHLTYTPLADAFPSKEDPLGFWLTERYCIWLKKHNKTIVKAPLIHQHWTLQQAHINHLTFKGLAPFINNTHFQDQPVVHYSPYMEAFLHPFEKY